MSKFCGACGRKCLLLDMTYTQYYTDTGKPYRTGYVKTRCPKYGDDYNHFSQLEDWGQFSKRDHAETVVFDADPDQIKWQKRRERMKRLIRILVIIAMTLIFAAVVVAATHWFL